MSSLLKIDTPYLCHIDLKISSLTAVTFCRLELQPVVTKIPKCEVGMKGFCEILFTTIKILTVGTTQTIAIIVLKLVKFDVTLH